VTSLGYAFRNASLNNIDISSWDTSNVSNFSGLFSNATLRDINVTGWDTTSAEKFSFIFANANITNIDMSSWNTSAVTQMNNAFQNARLTNCDVSGWDSSNVYNIASMFYGNSTNGVDFEQIKTWSNFSNVTDAGNLFYSGSINSDLNWLYLPKVERLTQAFYNASLLNADIELVGWGQEGSGISSLNSTFYNAKFPVNSVLDLTNWNVSPCNTFSAAFFQVTNGVHVLGLETWDTSSVTCMATVFKGANMNADLSGWTTSRVISMNGIFQNSRGDFVTTVYGWDTRNCQDFTFAFSNSSTPGDVTSWSMSSANNVVEMFSNNSDFDQAIGRWSMGNVRNVANMLFRAEEFKSDIHTWCLKNAYGNTNFYEQTLLKFIPEHQPQNYKCPPQFKTQLVIADPQSSATELGHSVEVVTLGEVTPSSPYTLQWQRRGEADLNWSNIIGETGESYDIELDDLRGYVRLRQIFTGSDGGEHRMASNEIKVLDFITPQGMGITFSNTTRGEETTIHFVGNVTQPSTITYEDGTVTNILGDFNVTFDELGTYFLMTNFLKTLSFKNTNTEMFISPTSDMGRIENAHQMFFNVTRFNQDLSFWDVSYMTDMSEMFEFAVAFNGPLVGWNTSNVTNMHGMFNNASSFNQPISTFDLSSTTDVSGMFAGAYAFNQSLNTWDVSQIQSFDFMFVKAVAFNGNVSGWTTTSATNMYAMFAGATKFNGSINAWNTAAVTNMQEMFDGASIFNQDIGGWQTGAVTNMAAMFRDAANFERDLSGWCVLPIPGREDFATGAKFEGKPELQPQWGTCP
jgi:surface protein